MTEQSTTQRNETVVSLRDMANAVRILSLDAVVKANSGHSGLPLGMADVATVLFSRFAKFDVQDPAWPDRDRVVLSAGHGSMLLYACLHLLGFEDASLETIRNFRQLHSKAAGHPEYGVMAGVETTTGPLGQGLAHSIGMALAERLLAARFGEDVVDHFTYVIASDGDLMEGVSHEAISLAGHLRLSKLIVLFDDNGISIDGPLSLAESGDQIARFKAAGWDTAAIDGHDPEAIAAALEAARKSDRPSLIACKTTIGFGAPTVKGTASAHGAITDPEEVAGVRKALGWTHEPFDIPEGIVSAWREAAGRNEAVRADWDARLDGLAADRREEWDRCMMGAVTGAFDSAVTALKRDLADNPKTMATRKASGLVLETYAEHLPEMISGSADLTGSNNTRTKPMTAVTAEDFSGRFIHYGVREHGMAAAMNGMALHGGLLPYAGTFMVFSDYMRPAIRLAAMMKQRVVFVLTHDSIGLGEDGPTHQPVEHLAALRAIPNLQVFRPADAVEAAECWQVAIKSPMTPSAMALTRQDVPPVRRAHTDENLSAKGGYELSPADGKAAVTLIATGSEVHIALEAQTKLASDGIPARVVSMPCWEVFTAQDEAYRQSVLGPGTLKLAIEAGVEQGWERFIGPDGLFVGMTGFGESAPYQQLYNHFGITADAVCARVSDRLAKSDQTVRASK